MARLHPSNVKEVASNKPSSGATAFTLPDFATAPYRSFNSALTTGDTVPVHATNGTDWMDFIGTFTAGTPDSLAQTTLLDSSTGSAIDWSAGGDVTLEVAWVGKHGEQAQHSLTGQITGLLWSYASAPDQITIDAGSCDIGGVMLTRASSGAVAATVTSLGIWYIYAYNSSGTLTFEYSQTDPTPDATLNYLIKTGDATRRYIGWYLVYSDTTGAATNKVAPFLTTLLNFGREVELHYKTIRTTGAFGVATTNLVAAGTSTTFAAISLASLVPACATHWRVFAGANGGAAGDDVSIGLRDWAHVTSDLAFDSPYTVRAQPPAAAYVYFGTVDLPISNATPEYYYAISRTADGTALIRCYGATIRR